MNVLPTALASAAARAGSRSSTAIEINWVSGSAQVVTRGASVAAVSGNPRANAAPDRTSGELASLPYERASEIAAWTSGGASGIDADSTG
jgi:hypothetical protein